MDVCVSTCNRVVHSLRGLLAPAACLALVAACRFEGAPPPAIKTRLPSEPSLPEAVIPAAYIDARAARAIGQESPVETGPDGTELANGQAGPGFIAVDDHFAYWTNFEDDSVLKVEKDGSGRPTAIGHNDRGTNKHITADQTAVYWGGTSLYRQVKATGATKRFRFDSLLVYNVVPVGKRIYWVDGGREEVQLRSMKLDGTDVRAIGSAEPQDFMIAIDGSSAFKGSFTLDAEDEGRIDVIPLAGGPATPFANTRHLWGIALDPKFVYWLEGRTLGAIKKKARTGKGDAVTLTEGFRIAAPQSLTSDASSLYWTQLGAGSGQGAIGKVSKAGGDAKWLAERQVVPQAITVDEGYAYWVNFGPTRNGTVRRVRK